MTQAHLEFWRTKTETEGGSTSSYSLKWTAICAFHKGQCEGDLDTLMQAVFFGFEIF